MNISSGMAAFTLGVLKVSIEASCKNSYHPLFSSPDGDVILRSAEGTLYRLHSYILRTSSGLFETMFSLPQPKIQPKICRPSRNHHYPTSPDILDVYEADSTMERILKLIYGIPTPPRMSFDEIETILALAEKWDTQGPIASLRSAFSSPQILSQYPIRCYGLSRYYGWDYEARLASTHTLSLDLSNPIYACSLDQLSSKDLLPLLNLRRKRKDMFRQLLNSPERFAAGNRSVQRCC
jgi:BTB/POZ domain